MIEEMIAPVRHFLLRRQLRARYYEARTEFVTCTYLMTHDRKEHAFDAWCSYNLARSNLDSARAEYLASSGVVETSPCATTVRVPKTQS